MAKKVYGNHARDHMPGGADPLTIQQTVHIAARTRSSTTTLTGTPGYDEDALVDWSTFASSSTDLTAYTDGNGDKGIKVSGPGHFLISAYVQIVPADTGSSNTGRLVPPVLWLNVRGAGYLAQDFASVAALTLTHTPQWRVERDAEYAIAAASGGYTGNLMLGGSVGHYVYEGYGGGAAANDWAAFTCHLVSEGGAHQWAWSGASLIVQRLGEYAPPL